jgi:NADPH:quinone reductase-like Zn-dependent oxidoreductase
MHRRRGTPTSASASASATSASALDDTSVPTHARGIYYGEFQQPVYEKSVPLQKQKRNNDDEVLVQVHAVGLNPVDAKQVIGDKLHYDWTRLRRWTHNWMVQDTRVGFDFAGVVLQNNHPQYPRGTRVFGTMPPLKGSCADYLEVPVHQLAKAPGSLTLEEAAALPLVGLTAWQALSPCIVRDISNVLIIGGSGGTGHVALQVAKALGAREVVTICSTRNIEFVKECGATQVVDYSSNSSTMDDLQQYAPFDVILDCVTSADPEDARHDYPTKIRTTPGLVAPQHLYQRLGGAWGDWIRAGLARHKIFPHSWLWKDPRERLFWIRFPHSSQELHELARIANAGQLKPRIQTIYPELKAATVQQAFDDILGRRVQGKVVVKIVPDEQR